MTVQELVVVLMKYPPSMRVVVDGYEGGYDDPHPAKDWVCFRIVPRQYEILGAHVDPSSFGFSEDHHPPAEALILSRSPPV